MSLGWVDRTETGHNSHAMDLVIFKLGHLRSIENHREKDGEENKVSAKTEKPQENASSDRKKVSPPP